MPTPCCLIASYQRTKRQYASGKRRLNLLLSAPLFTPATDFASCADVILHRPPLNVITMDQREQLREVFKALDADPR